MAVTKFSIVNTNQQYIGTLNFEIIPNVGDRTVLKNSYYKVVSRFIPPLNKNGWFDTDPVLTVEEY